MRSEQIYSRFQFALGAELNYFRNKGIRGGRESEGFEVDNIESGSSPFVPFAIFSRSLPNAFECKPFVNPLELAPAALFAEKQSPGPHSARGVNPSSYKLIIGNRRTEVKIT